MKIIIAFTVLAAIASAKLAAPTQMIDEINEMGTTWYAVENPISRLPIEVAQAMLGVAPEAMAERERFGLPYTPPSGLKLPTEFDARTQWGGVCKSIGHIRDQRHCGSCWAFGAVEAMSDRLCMKVAENIELSAEDMNSCCGNAVCGSCTGGYPARAWTYWEKYGLVTEECYPYSAGTTNDSTITPPCLKRCTGDTTRKWDSDKYFGTRTGSTRGEANMMEEIYKNGPVEVAFTVYQDFMSYGGGIYKRERGDYLGGHAVKMLGWGEEQGVKYWLCANSWNTSWGEKGFFRILRGKNECGIEGAAWYGFPK